MKAIPPLLFVLTICGCTYTAKPWPMKPEMVTPFQSSATIKVVNTQTTGTTLIVNTPAQKVNLKDATDKTITLLKEELGKSGVKHDDAVEKSLALSIDSVAFQNYFVAVGCDITVTYATGDGDSNSLVVDNRSGIDLNYACNFAITKAVAAIINDSQVRNYLTSESSSRP